MSCNNFPVPYIHCEAPGARVDKDLKTVKERYGIDLSKYRELFFIHAGRYVIESFPRLIGSKEHTLYNVAIFLSGRETPDVVIVINTQRQKFRKIPKAKHKSYTRQWLAEADLEAAEREKDQMREKLRSVGVNVKW